MLFMLLVCLSKTTALYIVMKGQLHKPISGTNMVRKSSINAIPAAICRHWAGLVINHKQTDLFRKGSILKIMCGKSLWKKIKVLLISYVLTKSSSVIIKANYSKGYEKWNKNNIA